MFRAPALPLCAFLFYGCAFQVATTAGDETKVSINEVPPAVKASILKTIDQGRLVDIGRIVNGDSTTYEIELVHEGTEYDVLFSSEGKVLSKSKEGVANRESDDEDAGEDAEGDDDNGEDQVVFQSEFQLPSRTFDSHGRNRFFILEPGYQMVLQDKKGEQGAKLIITVLPETKKIGDIETRVVEEREFDKGQLIEVSRNFMAICRQTSSVFYFGEEVDIYRDGQIVSHDGAWTHGENGATAGIMMPGDPLVGAAYYQEHAPGVAMDRAQIVSTSATIVTPAAEYVDCLKVREENPLDGDHEYKIHAPGIGLVQDEDLLLVKAGFVNQ